MGFTLGRCPNGHYYDSAQFLACPVCGVPSSPIYPPVSAETEKPYKLKIVKCINGHYYNNETSESCPECGSVELGDDEEKAEEIRLLEEMLRETETGVQYYREQVGRLKKRIDEINAEYAELESNR